MFKLFKTTKPQEGNIEPIYNKNLVKEVIKMENRSTQDIIDEIHETFYTEVDRLLAEAKILKSTDTRYESLIEKSKQLKALGFTNTKECKDAPSLNCYADEGYKYTSDNSKYKYIFNTSYLVNKFHKEVKWTKLYIKHIISGILIISTALALLLSINHICILSKLDKKPISIIHTEFNDNEEELEITDTFIRTGILTYTKTTGVLNKSTKVKQFYNKLTTKIYNEAYNYYVVKNGLKLDLKKNN